MDIRERRTTTTTAGGLFGAIATTTTTGGLLQSTRSVSSPFRYNLPSLSTQKSMTSQTSNS